MALGLIIGPGTQYTLSIHSPPLRERWPKNDINIYM
jgi:hypothetical protein